jgi:SAM-dependent methyltransferase
LVLSRAKQSEKMRLIKRYARDSRSTLAIIERKFSRYLLSNVWGREVPKFSSNFKTTHVDIGAGNNPRNTFGAAFLIAVDLFVEPKVIGNTIYIKCDATSRIPIEDNSVESISCYDFMEHVPRWTKNESDIIKFPFIEFMNEMNRCLKPGGIFYAITPAFPSGAAFQDPTHVNFISVKTIEYFAGSKALARELGYGFTGSFEVVAQKWMSVKDGFPKQSRGKWMIGSNLDWTNTSLIKALFISTPNYLIRRFFQKKTHLLWVLQKNF